MNIEDVKKYFTRLKMVGLLPNTEHCAVFLKSYGLEGLLDGN